MKAQTQANFRAFRLILVTIVLFCRMANASEIAPRLRSSQTIAGPISDLKARGAYGLAAAGTRGVLAIDLLTPTPPYVVSEVKTPGTANRIEISGTNAFLAAGDGGLQIIDFSNPLSLRIVGSAVIPGCADIAVVGNAVYIVSHGNIVVVDASNPAQPEVRQTLTGVYANRIAANKRVLCSIPFGPGATTASLFDLTDPFHPQAISTITRASGGGGWDGFVGVKIFGNSVCLASQLYAVCCEGTSLPYPTISEAALYDISNPQTPLYREGWIGAQSLYVDDRYLFSPSGAGFGIFEIGANGEFYRRSLVANAKVTGGAVSYANHIYIAAGDQLLNYETVLANPRSSSTTLDGQGVLDVVTQGNYAYLATREGLTVMDVRDSTRPQLAGEVHLSSANSVLVRGNYAYLSRDSGLETIDISNPQTPVRTSHIDMPLQQIAFVGDRIYGCNPPHDGYLVGFDISNPASPDMRWPRVAGSGDWQPAMLGVLGQIVFLNSVTIDTVGGTWFSYSWLNGVAPMQAAFTPTRAYITRNGNFEILNLTNVGVGPKLMGSATSVVGQVTVLGKYAYVASGTSLTVVDISQESAPHVVARNESLAAYRTATDGHRLFVAANNDGFSIMEPYPQVWFRTTATNPLSLVIEGPPALSGEIQRSSNLTEWTDWLPLTFGDESSSVDLPGGDSLKFFRFRINQSN